MKKLFIIASLFTICAGTQAQNVGIGTTTPGTKLTVFGTGAGIEHTDGTISIKSVIGPGYGLLGTISNHPLYLSANNTTGQLAVMPTGVIGIGNSAPTLAGLVVDKKVGGVNAMFGSNLTGIAIESSNPGIGFNSYYSSGRKFMAAGYGGVVGFDPSTGGFIFVSSTASGSPNAALTSANVMTISNTGATQIQGTAAGYGFADRTLSNYAGWNWYADAGKAFLFRNTSGGNFLTIDQNGNMGIGTSTPAAKLEATGTIKSTTAANSVGFLQSGGGVNLSTYIGTPTGGSLGGFLSCDHPLYLGTNNFPLISILTNGLVGIGSLPAFDAQLSVNGDVSINSAVSGANANIGLTINAKNGTQANEGVYINATGGTQDTYGVKATATNGVTPYGVYAFGYDGSTASYGIYGGATGSQNNYGVYGYVIGNQGWAGYFQGNVFSTGTYQTSDETLKTNIKTYPTALASIKQLSVKTYKYLQDGMYKSLSLPTELQIGIMAQDIEKVFPALVKKAVSPINDEKTHKPSRKTVEFKAVNYTGLIPVLVKAVQELSKTNEEKDVVIKDQASKLADLQQQLNQLNTGFTALKKMIK